MSLAKVSPLGRTCLGSLYLVWSHVSLKIQTQMDVTDAAAQVDSCS